MRKKVTIKPLHIGKIRHGKKNKKEIGLSPDELLFRGVQRAEDVQFRIIDFNENDLLEIKLNSAAQAFAYKDKPNTTWFNVDGLHDPKIMLEIASGFDLEQMVLAEVMDTHSRPRVQDFDNCVLLTMKMLRQENEDAEIEIENLSIVITKNDLISFQERIGDVFEPIRDRIRKGKKRIRSGKPDYLAFTLMDVVIDNYIYILGNLGEKIENLEERLLSDDDSVIDEIKALKRTLLFLRKNIIPAREMILSILKKESEFLHKSNVVYYKELQNNIIQAVETTEGYREILSDQLNIYHTTLSTKLNDTMKFLTVFSVIFIPLTFIAGIYGTNFDNVPELHYEYSYFIMWGIMIVITISMLFYFRKRKWF